MIVSILIFLLIFMVTVISHEFGHYIVAKKNGIHASEFFVGIGPKLISWVHDDTEFSLRAFPFGGACVFEGQNVLDDEDDGLKWDFPSEHTFQKASVWGRIATTFAGPFFNILIAYICGVIVAASAGVLLPEIQTVMENSGAEEAGLMPGDMVTRINGHRIHLSEEISFASYISEGEEMTIQVIRDGKKMDITVVPRFHEEEGRYLIGITNGKLLKCNALQSLKYGFYNVEYILKATVESIRLLIRGRASKDDLSGPVGIVKIVDDTYDEAKQYGVLTVVLSMLNLTMVLCANLAVMNLLPIPALDGGRLVFLFIEAIRGKPIPPKKEGYVHLAGMAALLALVVFVFFNDITKFFR